MSTVAELDQVLDRIDAYAAPSQRSDDPPTRKAARCQLHDPPDCLIVVKHPSAVLGGANTIRSTTADSGWGGDPMGPTETSCLLT